MAGDLIGEMDMDYARTVADSALRLMSEHSVPATPPNFSVWFNYAMGATPALRKTIDILIGNKREFDASINYDLYVTYLSPRSDAAVEGDVPDRLRGVMDNAKQYLENAIADNRTQIAALGEVSSQYQAERDPRTIIERLVAELSDAITRASNLETGFASSARELDSIRASLKEAERRSNTDALTGLANRRAVDGFLRSAQIFAMEKGEPLGVLLIDIDHFKKFNDSYGHHVGDQVLQLVAKVLQDNVRKQDLAARYGGEEMMVVLPGATLEECAEVAERIRRRIADARLTRRTTGQELSSVTVSIGAVRFRLAESAEAMIERCDRALYQAKRSGRNRTVTETEIEGEVVAA